MSQYRYCYPSPIAALATNPNSTPLWLFLLPIPTKFHSRQNRTRCYYVSDDFVVVRPIYIIDVLHAKAYTLQGGKLTKSTAPTTMMSRMSSFYGKMTMTSYQSRFSDLFFLVPNGDISQGKLFLFIIMFVNLLFLVLFVLLCSVVGTDG